MKYIQKLPLGIRQLATIIGAIIGLILGLIIAAKADEYEFVDEDEDDE